MNILYFEDNKVQQEIVSKYTQATLGAKTCLENTLYNTDIFLKTHYIEKFDIVICDYCFPGIDATEKLEDLRDCGKPVLFYTCLDEKEFEDKVIGKLGEMPYNFQYVRKATTLRLLLNKIKLMLGIK